jgi:excisionase family DNA binding protein
MRQACEILNCHPNTLRNYANSGKIDTYRIGPQGKRRFLREDILALTGLEKTEEKNSDGGQILIYARVSSSGQKGDLVRQVERLKEYVRENYGREADKVF